MHIHPVPRGDLDIFIGATGSPDYREEFEQYLDRMFAAGSMRPEWCFIAEEGDRPVGRVAFWTLPGMEEPFALVLLDVNWDRDHANAATRLLEDVLSKARVLGAEEIEHVIDNPPMQPQFQYHANERIELLESLGFSLRRETSRFERRGGVPSRVPERLSFRTLPQVGEEAFVDAMRKVSEGTHDREILAEIEKLGAE